MHTTIGENKSTQVCGRTNRTGIIRSLLNFVRSKLFLTVVVLGLTLAASAFVIIYRTQLEGLGRLGYLGALGVATLGNAIVGVPLPWLFVVAPMGGTYSPLGLALFAGFGSILGSLLPYALGRNIDHKTLPGWASNQLKDSSMTKKTLIVLGLAFSPLFSYPTLAAGLLKYPLFVTLLLTFLVEGAKVLILAYAVRFGLQIVGL